ncbi:MAG: winged helix-turn-helix transcriptional regulator [Archaeoglobus sp.]|nr:winged helix-turn-helix transcriptional regulator [Archaeoglobus sp.]
MPKREKTGILDYLDTYAFVILRAIGAGKPYYSEIMRESGLVRSNFNRRLNQLLKLGLIRVDYVKDPNPNVRRPKAVYSLTDTGRRILELLEEIERIYEEGVSEEERFEKEAKKHIYES